MAALSTFQSGPKGTKMVNLSVFDHLGPFWAALEPFGPFQTKVDFFAPKHLHQILPCPFGSRWAKRVPYGQHHFDPFWTVSNARKCQNQDTLLTLTS